MEVLGGNAYLVMCDWSQIPHLSEEVKAELLASYPEYQRDARSKGIPQLGSGAVYKIAESQILVEPFELPTHWPRCYGFDIGWRWSSAIFLSMNRDTQTVYVFDEYYRAEAEPVVHAEAIKARGAWIKGAIDPAARGRSQIDGRNLLQMYTDLGLHLCEADNAVESGIYEIWTMMSGGRFKVFKNCQRWLSEFRLYRRDEKGRIIKDNDHGLDATRYGISKLHEILGTAPAPRKQQQPDEWGGYGGHSTGWMG